MTVAATGTGQERPAFSTDRQSHPPMSARRHGPTTPLRRVSRGSFSKGQSSDGFPLDSLEPAFAELSDALTDLNANFEQLQDMHNSLARFSESFSSFLYGLNMNAFCSEFPQAPTLQSFKRNEGGILLTRLTC
jgi:DASH complex subunit DAM1